MRRYSRRFSLLLALLAFPAAAAAQGVIFEGLVHTPLGDATLAINSQDQLVVGNIGTRNGDGVSVDLGRMNVFEMHLQAFPAGLPAGASFDFLAVGSVSDVPDLAVANLTATRTSSLLRLNASFPAFSSAPKTVEVYFEGFLVASVPNVSISQVGTVPPDSWPTAYGIRREVVPQNRPALVCEWPGPVPIVLPGGTIASGDELRVVVMTAGNTLDFVAQIGGTGSDVPDMFIDGEEVQPACPGDVNGDGVVDLADLTILLGSFGLAGNVSLMDGDLNLDGTVDLADLTELLSNFGASCG